MKSRQRGAVLIIWLVGACFGAIMGWGLATRNSDGKSVDTTHPVKSAP